MLSNMGLGHVAGSKVGGHIVRGISGGERRRVSIAVQLLQDPRETPESMLNHRKLLTHTFVNLF